MTDARFEEGHDRPLNIGALDADDLAVISALAQDAVFPAAEMRWQGSARRFVLLVNRFRWEDAGRDRHGPERVQALLVFENILGVASQGVDRGDPDMVFSLLSVDWQPGEDAAGEMVLTLAGDGAIRLRAEALEARLRDVTRPYRAPSKQVPEHPED